MEASSPTRLAALVSKSVWREAERVACSAASLRARWRRVGGREGVVDPEGGKC